MVYRHFLASLLVCCCFNHLLAVALDVQPGGQLDQRVAGASPEQSLGAIALHDAAIASSSTQIAVKSFRRTRKLLTTAALSQQRNVQQMFTAGSTTNIYTPYNADTGTSWQAAAQQAAVQQQPAMQDMQQQAFLAIVKQPVAEQLIAEQPVTEQNTAPVDQQVPADSSAQQVTQPLEAPATNESQPQSTSSAPAAAEAASVAETSLQNSQSTEGQDYASGGESTAATSAALIPASVTVAASTAASPGSDSVTPAAEAVKESPASDTVAASAAPAESPASDSVTAAAATAAAALAAHSTSIAAATTPPKPSLNLGLALAHLFNPLAVAAPAAGLRMGQIGDPELQQQASGGGYCIPVDTSTDGSFHVLAAGDSITQGSVPSRGFNYPYTIKLEELLRNKLGPKTRAIDAGLGGGGIYQAGFSNPDKFPEYYREQLRTRKWDVSVIMIGINDLLRGSTPAAEIMTGLQPLLDETLAAGTPIVSIPPFASPGFVAESDSKEGERKKLAELLKAAAAARAAATGGQGPQIWVLDLQAGSMDFYKMSTEERSKWLDDGLHLTQWAYDQLGQFVYDEVLSHLCNLPQLGLLDYAHMSAQEASYSLWRDAARARP